MKGIDKGAIIADGETFRSRWRQEEPWKSMRAQLSANVANQQAPSLSALATFAPVLSDGRCDLRGFDFCGGKPCSYGGGRVLTADFSYSISEYGFTVKDAVFRNTRFFRSLWWLARFDGCIFEKCLFDESLFYNVNLGANAQFRNCSFRGVSTRGEFFSFGPGARFQRCEFEDVIVQKVAEIGVRFEGCVFSALRTF